MPYKVSKILWGIFVCFILFANHAVAGDTLSWSAVIGDTTGYKIYYGTDANNLSSSEDVGNTTEYSLSNFTLSPVTTYYFAVTAYNAYGESDKSATVSYTTQAAADTTPPMNPSGLVAQIVDSNSINLTWTANTDDDFNHYNVYYRASGEFYSAPLPAGSKTSQSIPGLNSGGTYYFVVSAVDTSGNESAYSEEVSATIPDIDNIPPEISILYPASDGNTYTTNLSSITLSGTSSDNSGVVSVTWENSTTNGTGTASGRDNWSAEMPLALGENIITVSAEDAAGNTKSDAITVTYTVPTPVPVPVPSDTTNPTVSIVLPTSNATYSTQKNTITLSGNASDNVALESVTWSNASGGNGTASGTTNWTISDMALKEGQNFITVTVTDSSGNRASDSLNITYTPVDDVLPQIAITSPTTDAGYTTKNKTVTLSGTASDNVGLKSVTWSNASGGNGTASGTTSWTISDIALNDGQNIVTVTVTDASGNRASDSLNITYTPVDDVLPQIAITSPTTNVGYTTKNKIITLSGTASDNAALKSVTWSNASGGNGTASGTTSWTISDIALNEGQNIVTVTVTDASGNRASDSMTITYTPVDDVLPQIAITSPTRYSVYTSKKKTVTLSGTASDNVGLKSVTWTNTLGGNGTASGTTSWTVSKISLASGQNEITVTAEDKAGNQTQKTLIVIYKSEKQNHVDIGTAKDQGGVEDDKAMTVCNGSGNNYEATTFVAGDTYSLSRAELKLRRKGFPSMEVSCIIYSDNGGKPGSIIGRSEPVRAETITKASKGRWTAFVFTNKVNIEKGNTYWIGIYGPGGNTRNCLQWRYQASVDGNHILRHSRNGTQWKTRNVQTEQILIGANRLASVTGSSSQHAFITY